MTAKSTNSKMIPTKHSGVYQRASDTKKFDGKPDACFYITYKMPNGKKVWEKIGVARKSLPPLRRSCASNASEICGWEIQLYPRNGVRKPP